MLKKNYILIFLLINAILIFKFFYKKNAKYIKSSINNKFYFVKNCDTKYEAANILASIENRILKLNNYLYENKTKYNDYKDCIEQLNNNLKHTIISENVYDEEYTSYSINKGEQIILCLYSKKNNQLHDLNTIMYVVLHELAHVACSEIGHTKVFYDIFKFFLKIAKHKNLYLYENYNKNPIEYCGIDINENLI